MVGRLYEQGYFARVQRAHAIKNTPSISKEMLGVVELKGIISKSQTDERNLLIG